MKARVDADVLKYACGFACEKVVFTSEQGDKFMISQIKGGMRLINCDTKKQTDYPGVRSKAGVIELLDGEYTKELVPEPVAFCQHTVRQMLNGIIKASGADEYQVYLTRGKCFRFGVYDEYKANRANTPKPYHLETIEEYLIKHHGAVVYTQIEADDALGIDQLAATKAGEQSIICTIDKDLDMIPGWRYDWNKKVVWFIEPEAAMYSFWRQMLTGDAADNIPGLQGIGNKTADKMLADVNPKDYKRFVTDQYAEHKRGDDFEQNAMLLWMLRKPLEETYGKTYEQFFYEKTE